MFVWIFLMSCDKKEESKREVIRTPYGHDCVVLDRGERMSAIECWDSEGPPPKEKE